MPVHIENLAPGMFAIVATSAVQLRRVAQIEQLQPDGAWVQLTALGGDAGYRLSADCSDRSADSECVSLARDVTLLPKPWSGLDCAAQCAASCSEEWFHDGVHRLVVSACEDPSVRVAGDSFSLPSTAAALPRWRAAHAIDRATAFRVDYVESEGSEPRILEQFTARQGTERVVGREDIDELADLLRSEHGFTDDIVKRCFPGPVAAFTLTHERLPSSSAATPRRSDVVLDFGCYSLRVPNSNTDPVAMTYFDPSHAAFIALAKRIFAGDDEMVDFDISRKRPAHGHSNQRR